MDNKAREISIYDWRIITIIFWIVESDQFA